MFQDGPDHGGRASNDGGGTSDWEGHRCLTDVSEGISSLKENNETYSSIYQRLKELVDLVDSIQQDVNEDSVNAALEKLGVVLSSADRKIKKYKDKSKLSQMLKTRHYKSEFAKINQSLSEAFMSLSAALHIHQTKKLVEHENMIRVHDEEPRRRKPERKGSCIIL